MVFCILERKRKRNDDEEKEAKNKITKQKTDESGINGFDVLSTEIHCMIFEFVVSVSGKKWKSNWKNNAEVSKIWNEEIWYIFHKKIPMAEKTKIFYDCCQYACTSAVKKMLMYKNFNPSDLFNQAIEITINPMDCPSYRNYGYVDSDDHSKVFFLLLRDNRIDPSIKNNFAITEASRQGKTKLVKLLLQDKRVNPAANDNEAIREACYENNEIVKLLLQDKRVDPAANNNEVILVASRRGYADIVELLLKDTRVDPTANDNEPIRGASEFGEAEVVELLLNDKRVDPSSDNNYAIRHACHNDKYDTVKILLEDNRVDPSANDNEAIQGASKYGHTDIVKLLLKDTRVDPTAINFNKKK